MLADVYIPCETDPSCPHLEDIPAPPDQTEEEVETSHSNSVPVRSLCVASYKSFSSGLYQFITSAYVTTIGSFLRNVYVLTVVINNFSENKFRPRPPPIVGSIDERCKAALLHVLEGLDCLQYFKIDSENKVRF